MTLIRVRAVNRSPFVWRLEGMGVAARVEKPHSNSALSSNLLFSRHLDRIWSAQIRVFRILSGTMGRIVLKLRSLPPSHQAAMLHFSIDWGQDHSAREFPAQERR